MASFLFVQYQSADTVFFNKCQQVPLLFRNLHVSHNKSGFSYTIKACQREGKDRTSHICAWITEGFNNIITDLLTVDCFSSMDDTFKSLINQIENKWFVF